MGANFVAESPARELEADRRGSTGRTRFARAAWGLLGYTVLVILWGAFVRATGAGAGCGSHWPLCNGEVLPRSPSVETVVEFSHRLSSGVLGLFVLAFLAAAFRLYPKGHRVRWGALIALLFVVSEALIGAGLVRFEWVAANDSIERVYVMGFHLVNTFLLLGAMTVTAWLAEGDRSVSLSGRGSSVARIALALAALLVVGASGAVTALGDTLLLTAGIRPEDSPVVAALLGARFYHPALALGGFAVVGLVVFSLRPQFSRSSRFYGHAVLGVFVGQLVLGALNVHLMAPVWMQLVHLAVSDLLWILLVLFAVEILATKEKALPRQGKGSLEL